MGRHAARLCRALLAATALLTLLSAGRPAGLARPTAPVAAQPAPAVDIALYGSTLTFRTLPAAIVNAELRDADGHKAEGVGFSDADGVSQVTFFLGDGVIRPGDTVVLSRVGTSPLEVDVPNLGIDGDVASDRIVGEAPAGAQVEVEIEGLASPRTVTAEADGSFRIDLAGELDLEPDNGRATARLTDADGNRFSASYQELNADITLGARGVSGVASPGTMVALTRRLPDGSEHAIGPIEVTNGPSFQLAGGDLADPDVPALAAGDEITVTNTERVIPSARSVTTTLQAIEFALNASTDVVSGTGPISTTLRVAADGMGGGSAARTVDTDAAGAFTLDLSDAADLAPGWRVRVSTTSISGVTNGALGVLPKARIGIGVPFGQGRAAPGQPVTITLRDAQGEVRTQAQAVASDQGEYAFFLGGFGPGAPLPEPGDAVEIAFVAGDPVFLPVPDLTAASDVDGDAVVGDAPVGATVTAVLDSAPGQPTATATVGPAGTYRAVFDGVDLERPADGSVALTVAGGNEFYTTWAAMQLSISPGSTFAGNFVIGNGPAGRQVHVELVDDAGRLVAEAQTTVFGGNVVVVPGAIAAGATQFFVGLTDTTGAQVFMEPGDTLRVTAGDELVELTMPPLDALVFVEQDQVTGLTLPDTDVDVAIIEPPTTIAASATIASNASGAFALTFDDHDIRFGDVVQLSIDLEGHQFLDFVLAPGLLLDADQAVMLGSLAPDSEALLKLERGGQVLEEQLLTTDADGALAMQFTGDDGLPLELLPGDRLSLEPLAPNLDTLELEIPDLVVDADVDDDTVTGRATAGGGLTMLATTVYPRSGTLGIAQAWPEVEAASTYAAEFVPSLDVRPGTRVFALYRPPAGHYVVRTRTVPVLNAEHSGPNMCGFGEPRQPAVVEARDAASVAGALETTARFDGYFSDHLSDAAGDALRTAEGHRVAADLASVEVETALGALDLEIDWQSGLLTGTGPAATPFFLAPAVPCPQQQQPGLLNVTVSIGFESQTGPDGSIQQGVPGFLTQPGSGLELAYYADNDHRVFRHLVRAQAVIFIGTDRIAGRANPLDAVSLALRDDTGAVVARGVGVADASGFFDLRLTAEDGSEVAIAEGDVVVLETPSEAPEVEVEPLSFDWSAGEPLAGRAPADRTVALSLRLAWGQVVTLDLEADAAGAFRFDAGDVPPRAAWSYDDVVALRVALTTQGGHQIINQTPGFEGPAAGPAGPIYLPLAMATHAADGSLAAGAPRPAVRAVPVAPRAWPVVPRPAPVDNQGMGLGKSPLR